MKEIRAEEYFSIGFELGKREYWTTLLNILIYVILAIAASMTVVGLLVVPAILVGLTKFLLSSARDEKISVRDSLSESFNNGMWWKALLYSFIYVVGVTAGFLLLIAPGFYLATAWLLGFYLLVDKDMLPIEALGKSRELVHQLGFWKIFAVFIGLEIVTSLLSFIASELPILGLATWMLIPFIMMTYIAIYENAIGNPLVATNEK